LLIIQIIGALDEITKVLNLLSLRVRELYGLHFPELNRLVEKHETYLKLVGDLGSRSMFSPEELLKRGFDDKRAMEIAKASSLSIGGNLSDEDIGIIKKISNTLLQLYSLKKGLEEYMDNLMTEVAPNIKEIAGPTVGARLIAVAGGLKKLATMPASTIQVLGAEKALFRALKSGTRPPKHGILFQHPAVHSADRKIRGKVARLLASKIAIAARVDVFTGKGVNQSLKESYINQLNIITGGVRQRH
jgi:nucleolar protein 56